MRSFAAQWKWAEPRIHRTWRLARVLLSTQYAYMLEYRAEIRSLQEFSRMARLNLA